MQTTLVLLRNGEKAEELKRELADLVRQELKMTLGEEKTAITQASDGFAFLGEHVFAAPGKSNPNQVLPYNTPAPKSVKGYRRKVRSLTRPHLDWMPPGERIRALNWLIVGWANYHRWGNAKKTFSALSSWTIRKVHTMLRRYTPMGKTTTYGMHFRPVSECTNLQRWKRYSNWLTSSVHVGEMRVGLLPMAVISTADYWKNRGNKIPPAFRLLDDETTWNERETGFCTDVEAIENARIGMASCWSRGKYSHVYFHTRKVVFRCDGYTCTVCG